MADRKQFLMRLTLDNYKWLCQLAERRDSSLNAEINRLVREDRECGSPTSRNRRKPEQQESDAAAVTVSKRDNLLRDQ